MALQGLGGGAAGYQHRLPARHRSRRRAPCRAYRRRTESPVPSGLVRISASPALRPLLRQSRSGTAVPLTVRPKASSAPSPGMAADQHRARLLQRLGGAGQELHEIGLDLRFGAVGQRDDGQRGLRRGTHGVEIAQAVIGGDAAEEIGIVDEGAEEIDALHQQLIARQTVTTAASSAGSSPTSTSGRDSGCSRRRTRASSSLPILAPQPPQRISGLSRRAIAGRAIARHGVELLIHAHPAAVDIVLQPPDPGALGAPAAARGDGVFVAGRDQREVMPLGPIGLASARRGRHGADCGPAAALRARRRRRTWPGGGRRAPRHRRRRTRSGCEVDCRQSLTATKPLLVRGPGRSAAARPAGAAFVSHRSPRQRRSLPPVAQRRRPGVTATTRRSRCSSTPRARTARVRHWRTPGLCVGSNSALSATMANWTLGLGPRGLQRDAAVQDKLPCRRRRRRRRRCGAGVPLRCSKAASIAGQAATKAIHRLDRQRVVGGARHVPPVGPLSRYRVRDSRIRPAAGRRKSRAALPDRARSPRCETAALRPSAPAGADRYGHRHGCSGRRRRPGSMPE